ncbi:Protein Skeletor, isoforms D/E [Toxocara canis]|uniref:Protein Skeletor, isoforms D/E n=2 Tax=Toxocara canis TaxID=6265 RepID=A0A0B2VZ51_TOXCA|nr:Protein Skeletor, isoforms D/E [Toxocara canis]VDM39472.1 unnamed protein product [Toxocara canis]
MLTTIQSYLSTVKLDKVAPAPYCCINNKEDARRGLIGFFYNVASGPITVLDAKTLLIPNFSFEGAKPPDGWIFTGKGGIDKATGKRAYIVGRDTRERHCPLREDYSGRNGLIIRLADDQTVYDINYVSVFCYEFAVDFGHVLFNLRADQVAVPPFIPPVQHGPNVVRTQTQC